MRKTSFKIFFLILVSCFLASCTQTVSDPAGTQALNAQTIFSDSITEFKVSVFYEAGAEPYTGILTLTNTTWDVTRVSYEQLFSTHTGRTVSVPTTLGAMTALADQNKTSWTGIELLDLAKQIAPSLKTGSTINMTVIFLNGLYNGSASTLGVQFTGFPYAFVFKDVVTGVGGGATAQRYIEQATVVHEIGHAVGLVNSGVPMVVAHEDSAHPHHSTNSNCVMYWAVTSTTDVLGFVTNYITGNALNLFGSESLQDGRGYHP
jgi:hypothetical protein